MAGEPSGPPFSERAAGGRSPPLPDAVNPPAEESDEPEVTQRRGVPWNVSFAVRWNISSPRARWNISLLRRPKGRLYEADFRLDVFVVGMQARQLAGKGVNLRQREFVFPQPADNVQDVQRPTARVGGQSN
jgi:hypothetical protein